MGIDMIPMSCSLYCRVDADELGKKKKLMASWLHGNYHQWINKQNVLSVW